jgi:hypothetical protein
MPVKFTEINKIPNGAQFYTADLHVHSFGGSHDITDKSMTVEALVDQAVKSGISILAITDHNSVKNTERSIELAQPHAGQLLVLAGLEVTTANGHLLVYFAPDAVHQIQSLIGKLNIQKPGTGDSHTSMSMSDVATEAMRLGGICVAAHIDRTKTGFETLAAGYPNWKKDIILNPGIVGLEVDDPAHLVWYSPDDEGTLEGNERKKLIEQRAKVPGATGRAILAHLQNSDAHTLQAFTDAQKKRTLTRFKMDSLSFEGFRTALADPDARVRATIRLPPAIPKIVGMRVEGGFLDKENYRFSDNLTCFIGGRGTGKSTALKCLAFGLGASEELSEYDNCPDTVVVFCRDAQGIVYRYERMSGSDEPSVQAAEGRKVIEAPADVFRVEYYGQGDLARVAEDPLNKPQLLQEFLDRHTQLDDLVDREAGIVTAIDENGSLLRPLETQEASRTKKDAELKACDAKLKLAEDGQLKAIAARQAAIGAEKALVKTIEGFRDANLKGVTLRNFKHDYPAALQTAGTLTGEATSAQRFEKIRETVAQANKRIQTFEDDFNALLKGTAGEIDSELKALNSVHKQMEDAIAQQVADLQKAGLASSVAEHGKVVARRGVVAGEISVLDQKLPELQKAREERVRLVQDLSAAYSAPLEH